MYAGKKPVWDAPRALLDLEVYCRFGRFKLLIYVEMAEQNQEKTNPYRHERKDPKCEISRINLRPSLH